MIAVEMPIALQQIIDTRLDNIERALMAQSMGRKDRQQILSAVEDQILEMLGQSSSEEPTRADVLSVLAKLDPPEAYLEVSDSRSQEFLNINPGERRTNSRSTNIMGGPRDLNKLAVTGFAVTCVAYLGAFTWWILGFFGLIPLSILTAVATVIGCIALYQFIQQQQGQRGLWMAFAATCCMPVVAMLSLATYAMIVMSGMT